MCRDETISSNPGPAFSQLSDRSVKWDDSTSLTHFCGDENGLGLVKGLEQCLTIISARCLLYYYADSRVFILTPHLYI